METNKINLLLICGKGRNGSTIFAKILDESINVLNIGEAPRYFLNKKMKKIPCECKKNVESCEFWSQKNVKVSQDILNFYAKEMKLKKIIKYILSKNLNYKNNFKIIKSIFFSIYKDKSNSLIIDSSKHPFHALLISEMEEVDVSYIHLVRSPYAFVASAKKKKNYLNMNANIFWLSFQWFFVNLFYEFFFLFKKKKVVKIFYEDFVDNTNKIIENLNKLGCIKQYNLKRLNSNNEIELSIGHSLAGNPSKFSKGITKIEYKGYKLSFINKIIVSIVCFPLLIKYSFEKSN